MAPATSRVKEAQKCTWRLKYSWRMRPIRGKTLTYLHSAYFSLSWCFKTIPGKISQTKVTNNLPKMVALSPTNFGPNISMSIYQMNSRLWSRECLHSSHRLGRLWLMCWQATGCAVLLSLMTSSPRLGTQSFNRRSKRLKELTKSLVPTTSVFLRTEEFWKNRFIFRKNRTFTENTLRDVEYTRLWFNLNKKINL